MRSGVRHPTTEVMLEQSVALRAWLQTLPFDAFERRSVLPDWDVRQLTAHTVLIHAGLLRTIDIPTQDKPIPPHEFVKLYRKNVDAIAFSTIQTAADKSPDDLLLELDQAIAGLRARFAQPLPKEIGATRGPTLLEDFLTTRIVELIVHSDDFSRSVPDHEPVPLMKNPLAAAVRCLADILAKQNPGRTVEVRVPPFVAVQIAGAEEGGQTHTRGTPPNVVETDPLTFVRLATGRFTLNDMLAEGRVEASGHRADLTSVLPVLS